MIQDRVWSSDNDQETAKEGGKEIRYCYNFYDLFDTRNTLPKGTLVIIWML